MTYLSIFIACGIILLTSFGQILLKKGANSDGHLILNRYVITGYFSFICVLLLSAVLMYTVKFKYFSVIVGLNYMATTLLAAFILKEKVTYRRYFGCFLIAVGSIIFTL